VKKKEEGILKKVNKYTIETELGISSSALLVSVKEHWLNSLTVNIAHLHPHHFLLLLINELTAIVRAGYERHKFAFKLLIIH
jgi:hypothetical protein